MPRNGSGVYTAPSSTWNPPVDGQPIEVDDYVAQLADISLALTGSIAADGQTAASQRIPFAAGTSSMRGALSGPAYSFVGDPDTGVYSAGANSIGLVAGGAAIATATVSGLGVPVINGFSDANGGFRSSGAGNAGSGAGVEIVYSSSLGSVYAFDRTGVTYKDIILGHVNLQGVVVKGNTGHTQPGTDNSQNLGGASNRWATVYAGTGSINTSDAREKTDVRALTADEVSASKALAAEIGAFKFLDAVAKKGDAARTHIGMTVQRAVEIMTAHSLDPMAYGFICHDAWGEGDTAGDRYGFRPDELLLFIARGFDARLTALEAA